MSLACLLRHLEEEVPCRTKMRMPSSRKKLPSGMAWASYHIPRMRSMAIKGVLPIILVSTCFWNYMLLTV